MNRASEALLRDIEHVYETASKTKGDPLPFSGSGVNEDGFWAAESESDDSEDDEDGSNTSRLFFVNAAKRAEAEAEEVGELEEWLNNN